MKKGILLINLGTPNKANHLSVFRYLNIFLRDKRVIDLPLLLRYALLYGFILPFRTSIATKAYRAIWSPQGSPLLYHSNNLVKALITKLPNTYKVKLGMRYGEPSIASALQDLQDCEEIVILPLYPQYASAATGSAIEHSLDLIKKWNSIPKITIISYFYNHPSYIQAQADHMKKWIKSHDHILFSYHGLPERQLTATCNSPCKTDCKPINHTNCYRAQCFATSDLLIKSLSLNPTQVTTAFQSRLGKTPWIKPYTDEVLTKIAANGVKKLLVVCPSFVVDCLETLEEIDIRMRKQWLDLGGEQFTLVPSLNETESWVNSITTILFPSPA